MNEQNSRKRKNDRLMTVSLCIFTIVILMNVSSYGEDTAASEKLSEQFRFIEYYIGDWKSAPEDPLLKQYPQLKDRIAQRFEWGTQKSMIQIFEGLPKDGDDSKATLEGSLIWNPVERKFKFIACNCLYGFYFEGEYVPMDQNRFQRIYTVYYPEKQGINPGAGDRRMDPKISRNLSAVGQQSHRSHT